MQQAIIFANMAGTVALSVSLVFLLRGIYSLISGKCSLLGNRVTGKQGRIAGLLLTGQFIVGIAFYALMFEANKWGSSGADIYENARKSITSGIAQAIIFTVAILLGYFAARAIAKAGTAKEGHSGEEETSES